MPGTYFLAIDGGGTNTRARLTDASARVLGEGLAGSSNLTLGVDITGPAIAEAGRKALDAAGLGPEAASLVRAGMGLSGANVPDLAAGIRAFPFGYRSVALASDAVTACLGAHAGEDGAILILGTGSQGLALVAGKETPVGGWGFALSDDASGALLGRAAIRAALLGADALGPSSRLTRSIMQRFHDDPSQAVMWGQTATPRDYGSFAPLVFQAAGHDAVADDLIGDAVRWITAMLDRLIDLGAPKIALMGGLAAPYRPFLPHRYDDILIDAKGDALDGALTLARNAG